jgi:hypothetical protein
MQVMAFAYTITFFDRCRAKQRECNSDGHGSMVGGGSFGSRTSFVQAGEYDVAGLMN